MRSLVSGRFERRIRSSVRWGIRVFCGIVGRARGEGWRGVGGWFGIEVSLLLNFPVKGAACNAC